MSISGASANVRKPQLKKDHRAGHKKQGHEYHGLRAPRFPLQPHDYPFRFATVGMNQSSANPLLDDDKLCETGYIKDILDGWGNVPHAHLAVAKLLLRCQQHA